MDESLFSRVSGAARSKQAWDALQVAYQGTAKVKVARLQILRRKFER